LVWEETPENWNLYSVLFSRGCQDNTSGFDGADIIYFKEAVHSKNYTTHEIQIYPTSGGVSWGGGEFPRPLFGWKTIQLAILKITADDAIQIAEDTGGNKVRRTVENACDIHVFLKPNGDDDNWHVIYFPNNGNPPIFEMVINPYSGKHKILRGSK
jgi:hypothetical protein